jgi:peptidoglycan-N-acetylglucosamine deacetylase
VPATFFVWGERAHEHPELIAEILAAGHLVQPHCWAHVSHWTLEREAIAADIDRALALLEELGAPPPTLWRPPYGKLRSGAVTRALAAERRLELVGWNVDPHDWAGGDPRAMLAQVTRELEEIAEEAVVLLHDGHREPGQVARRTDAGNTVELVRMLLAEPLGAFTTVRGGLEGALRDGSPQS